MTTQVTSVPNQYPFPTERSMRARLGSDPLFRVTAVLTMCSLQTPQELAREDTAVRNFQGFMSSDACRGTRLTRRLVNGILGTEIDTENKEADSALGDLLQRALRTPLSPELLSFVSPDDWSMIDRIGSKYAKQMARIATRRMIADDETGNLRRVAAVFSVT